MSQNQDKRIGWDAERIFSLDFNPQCYNLTPQQIEALLAIFPYISWERRWFNADAHSRDDRMKFAAELMYQLMNPVDCAAIEGENYCIEYPPHSDKIVWHPVSPYNDQENRPTFFSTPVWFVVNLGFWDNFVGDVLSFLADKLGLITLLQETTGLQNGDVFTCLFSLAQIEDLHLILDPPGFSVEVPAASTVELHFVNVPLGGMAYISLDTDVFEGNIFWDVVQLLDTLLDPTDSVIDLNLDLISFPPEFTAGASIHEVEIPNDGLPHTIYVRFLPVLDDALTFIRFGGGLRKIVICGEDALMPQVDCSYIQNCWEGNQDNVALQNVTVTQIANTTQQFLDELESLYDGTNPNSINASIPTTIPDGTQQNALCYAITAWVNLYAQAKMLKIRQASFVSQAWNSLQNAIVDAYGLLNNVAGFIVPDDLFSCFVSNSEALTALSDSAAIDELICAIYQELSGIALLETSLEGAISAAVGSLTGTAQDIACLLDNDYSEQHALNFYFLYGRALDNGLSAACCPIVGEWCYEWDFTIDDGGWEAFNNFGSAMGTYVAGTGWQYTDAANSGFVSRAVTIKMPSFTSSPVNIHELELEMDYGFGSFSVAGFGTNTEFIYMKSNTNTTFRAWTVAEAQASGFGGNGVIRTKSGANFFGNNTYFWLAVYSSNRNQLPLDYSGNVLLTHVRIKGTGTMPPFTGGQVC